VDAKLEKKTIKTVTSVKLNRRINQNNPNAVAMNISANTKKTEVKILNLGVVVISSFLTISSTFGIRFTHTNPLAEKIKLKIILIMSGAYSKNFMTSLLLGSLTKLIARIPPKIA
jgi:hypothetical protein